MFLMRRAQAFSCAMLPRGYGVLAAAHSAAFNPSPITAVAVSRYPSSSAPRTTSGLSDSISICICECPQGTQGRESAWDFLFVCSRWSVEREHFCFEMRSLKGACAALPQTLGDVGRALARDGGGAQRSDCCLLKRIFSRAWDHSVSSEAADHARQNGRCARGPTTVVVARARAVAPMRAAAPNATYDRAIQTLGHARVNKNIASARARFAGGPRGVQSTVAP
jgi:hypothetical protein